MLVGLAVSTSSENFLAGAYAGQRVIVTGHTGFKGSWLCLWLVKMGAEVCGYSDGIPTVPSLFELTGLGREIRHEIGDIRNVEQFKRLVESFRPDYVFHLAAQAIVSVSYADPVETISCNVLGTAAIMQALRDVTHPCVALIVTSDKCYENVEQTWGYREIDPLGGKDIYSASKGAAEIVAHSFHRSFFAGKSPVSIGTARAGNVLGGGDWAADRIIADCMRAWTNGEIVHLRRPNSTRPWQHVLEPLSGYLMQVAATAVRADLDGESFNFGPKVEQSRTVLELVGDLATIWGFGEHGAAYDCADAPPFEEAGLLRLNCDKALLKLKWEATLSYSECVSMTGSWYRDVLKNSGDARSITDRQIDEYVSLATNRGLSWARAVAS